MSSHPFHPPGSALRGVGVLSYILGSGVPPKPSNLVPISGTKKRLCIIYPIWDQIGDIFTLFQTRWNMRNHCCSIALILLICLFWNLHLVVTHERNFGGNWEIKMFMAQTCILFSRLLIEAKSIYFLRPNWHKNHTIKGGTYLYSQLRGDYSTPKLINVSLGEGGYSWVFIIFRGYLLLAPSNPYPIPN